MDTQCVEKKEAREEVVISLDDIGVSFNQDSKPDDYKSRIYDVLNRKKNRSNRSHKPQVHWSLRNINLVGYKGEILGIIGSNGSGKTTLCKLIAGVLQPDEGRITVNGRVSALFSLALGFNKEMTGRENVYLNGTMLGISNKKINSFVEEIKEFSGLGGYFDQPIKNYSSGMKARLGFSVAAFMEPEILILDEALNTGDLEFSQKAADRMKELVRKAKMVIIVTHSLKYAQKNCDRLIWIERGVVRAVGKPQEIVEMYEDNVKERKNNIKKAKKELRLKKIEMKKGEGIAVESKGVGVSYRNNGNQYWALKDINLKIHEGEVLGIIGHNGAGKSTLCKLLTNILVPDEGNLTINGTTTALLGYGTGFNGQLTGKDNIFLNGMLLGIPLAKIKRSYTDIVEFSELGSRIDQPVKQYSSGMRSRLGFSIAAFLEPDIFIIDEALSAGDLSFNQKASEKIQDMIRMAKAVIVVSHSMGFVEKVCTRAIWLNQGQIMQDGEPKEVIKNYKEYVQNAKKKLS